jgi:rhamnosyl/mannosyltransferase
LNILHIGKYFSPFQGGLENYSQDLMGALVKRGVSSAALVHRHDRSLRTQEDSVSISGHDFQVVRTGTWLKIFYAPISPAFPWQLKRLIARIEPDILHLHMPNPSAFWALLLPSARRLPWVVHWHADVITSAQGQLMKFMYFLYRPFEQKVLKHARAIVVTSPPYRESSQPLRPWLAKCRVVPLGLDASRMGIETAARRSEDEPSRGLRVLAVGRQTYYKGLRYLIEAAALVENLQLDLVGDGEQAPELRALAASLNLQDRVTFHGVTGDQELARLLTQCDCLCLPSVERTEAFGMVLLEAMCFGKATVVSDVPGSGMGWIVEHGVTGLKVAPADVSALAEAFRQLAADRPKLEEMGRRGKEKFDRMFEINHAAEGVVDTYRAVLASQPRADEEGFPSDQ